MNPMYDCSGRLDRFGGMTEPPDDRVLKKNLNGNGPMRQTPFAGASEKGDK